MGADSFNFQLLYYVALVLATYLVSAAVAWVIGKLPALAYLQGRAGRFAALDGVRGYLALGVFIHHFVFSWYWLNKNDGGATRILEPLFFNIGRVSVLIFFMITGFLFIRRILAGYYHGNWKSLYVSRFFRIYPLFIFVVICISLVVAVKTGFTLEVSIVKWALQHVKWLLLLGGQINNFADTWLVIFGVYWTLKYEWAFYLSIPLLALLFRLNRFALAILAVLTIPLFLYPVQGMYFSSEYLIYFAVGGVAAYLVEKQPAITQYLESRMVSVFALAAVLLVLNVGDETSLIYTILIALFFIPIANGNDLFRLLARQCSIVLGEISYSIYLMHGLLLYLFLVGWPLLPVKDVAFHDHLIWMPLFSGLVVLVSSLTFLFIEKPLIHFGKRLIRSNEK
ncbi:acyltransferase family protein [Ketobacter sp.]|uniref:acyltransferase family protein n=1 Tax=Ketobacter sp. TaxID=2083498 RepID=UPI000F21F144|nr:acyltransferase [Ketobacter sp.]RLT93675.1 MAG: acyltransferase [Ketobacter sp.]